MARKASGILATVAMLLIVGGAAAQPAPAASAPSPSPSYVWASQASPTAAPPPLAPLAAGPGMGEPTLPLRFSFPYPPAEDERAHAYSWYGWQILIGEISSDVTIFLGGTSNSVPIVLFGVIGRATSAPIVHLAHRRAGRAVLSFALEAIVPGMALGMATVTNSAHCIGTCSSALIAALTLVPVAMGVGTIVDAVILGGQEAATPEPHREGLLLLPLTIAPLELRAPAVGGRRAFAEAPVGLAIGARF